MNFYFENDQDKVLENLNLSSHPAPELLKKDFERLVVEILEFVKLPGKNLDKITSIVKRIKREYNMSAEIEMSNILEDIQLFSKNMITIEEIKQRLRNHVNLIDEKNQDWILWYTREHGFRK